MAYGALSMTRPITDHEIEAFERDGVVVLRQVLDPARVAAMADPVARAVESASSADLSSLAESPDGPRAPDAGRFYAGVDHWLDDQAFADFACRSSLPGVAAALLRSEHIWFYEDSVLVKEPGAAESTRFHQDSAYFHVAGAQACTFWVPLDPVEPTTGSLQFVRGSHTWERSFRPNLFVTDEPIPGTEGELVPDIAGHPDRYEILCWDLEPGDITVHHYDTLHGAAPNSSPDRPRRAISLRYLGDDIRFCAKPGAPMKPYQVTMGDGDRLDNRFCPQVFPAA
jgi:ectoine hydroxylase-related dioxygenase (phytanoyl-CoA dioxygenase family)